MTNVILLAIALALHVEGAETNTPPSDSGRAVGIGRTHPCTVREANRILKREEFTLADRSSPSRTIMMMGVILAFHHDREPKKSVVWLAARWRNPWSKTPAWHLKKLREAERELTRSLVLLRPCVRFSFTKTPTQGVKGPS